jgi:CHAT domain-containing protein
MALEGTLKEDFHSPRILHIATHGFFLPDQESDAGKVMLEDESTILRDKTHGSRLERFMKRHVENPLLRSGLALAGVNTWIQEGSVPPKAEDGILTAEDVSGLDLSDTELVVLSACETGMGEVHAGEGVFGLQRSFVLAGVRTLVMSLWKVPDWRTQELMQDFYGHFDEGYPCSDALRKAQLMIKARYAHPFNWGAFICQGDAGLVGRPRTRA